MTYKIRICNYCRHKVHYERRDSMSYGWYCGNHRSEDHPETFHGYLNGKDDVSDIEVIAVADVADALLIANLHLEDQNVD